MASKVNKKSKRDGHENNTPPKRIGMAHVKRNPPKVNGIDIADAEKTWRVRNS